MDLGIYTKKTSFSRRSNLPRREKYCLNCRKPIEEADTFLGRASFCSQNCKDKYLEDSRNR